MLKGRWDYKPNMNLCEAISFRLPQRERDEIEELRHSGKYRNRSAVLRSLVIVGLKEKRKKVER